MMTYLRVGVFSGALILSTSAVRSEDEVRPATEPTWKASAKPTWTAAPRPDAWGPSWLGGFSPALPAVSVEREVLPAPRAVPKPMAPAAMPAGEVIQSNSRAPVPDVEWLPATGIIRLDRPDQLPPMTEKLDVPPRPAPDRATKKILPPDGATPPAMILPPCRDEAKSGRPQRERGRKARTSAADPEVGGEPGFLEALAPDEHRLAICAEYLLWWARNDRVPALAATGVLGQPGTQTLFGPGPIDQNQRQGARVSGHLWLDECRTIGIDSSFVFLPRRRSSFLMTSDDNPVLTRPVFVLNTNSENAETVAFPGFSTGSLRVDASSQFWRWDANLIKRLCSSCDRSVDVFGGYRYQNLSESLRITEDITAGPGAPDPAGTRVFVQDSFATRNHFHGAQIGTHVEQRRNRFFVDLRASIAFGVNNQSVEIDGIQVRTRPGEPTERFAGGLLAASSNIGRHERSRFSIVPEIGLNVGYQLTPQVRGFVGYTVMYWTNVVRPGDQIDRVVDLALIPNTPPGIVPTGLRRPGVLFNESDFWVQGINVGFEWIW